MRRPEHSHPDVEFPTRYILDEVRFAGGHERICNKEELHHESTAHFPK